MVNFILIFSIKNAYTTFLQALIEQKDKNRKNESLLWLLLLIFIISMVLIIVFGILFRKMVRLISDLKSLDANVDFAGV